MNSLFDQHCPDLCLPGRGLGSRVQGSDILVMLWVIGLRLVFQSLFKAFHKRKVM